MGKFGLGKKSSEADEDAARSSLFGSRSTKKAAAAAAAAPPSSNPYAQPQNAPDAYMQDASRYGPGPGGPPPREKQYAGSFNSGGGEKNPGMGYGSGSSGRPTAPSQYGPGGYGGLGRSNSTETANTDANRDALFGEAQDRYQQRSQPPPYSQVSGGGPGGTGGYGGAAGGYGSNTGTGAGSGGYGTYGEDRQLTAEEEEEEDIQAAKQQIRLMKQEDVASTRNALRIAAQAEETGRGTLARLAAQGERIHNTEKNLDLATNQSRIAEDRAKELRTLNKSMFAMHVSNPFTSGQRRRQADEDVITRHQQEREQREATRAAAFESKARVDGSWKALGGGNNNTNNKKASKSSNFAAERARYQFEADSEDDEMEKEIDSNLDALGQAAGRLNVLARVTGKEVTMQNRHIETIMDKSDRVDDHIAANRARLDRIH